MSWGVWESYWIYCWLCVSIIQTETVSRDEAVDELRRSGGPTSVIVDEPRLNFHIIDLLLTNDLLQACHVHILLDL